MLAVERRACIKETIQEQKSVAVSDLARRFDVTEETIRRDLKVLEAQGVLTRTYGGAFIQGGAINEVDVTLRETSYVEAKRQIAAQCLHLIRNGDSIFLDSSTTALEIARAIRDMRLTVLTNSLLIADVLSHSESIRLQVIGGVLQPQSMSFLGEAALAALEDREHVRRTVENNKEGMRFYEQAFREMGLEWIPSQGNFILVKVGRGRQVFQDMLARGVIVRAQDGYGLPEWIRISVGTPAENARCIEVLKEVL